MTDKVFFQIPGGQIKSLAPNLGYCYASDRITVDGMKVGYMYRESPKERDDSGWNFLAGDESDEYLNDPKNLAIYDVNTIANFDPTIVLALDIEPPCAFEREPTSGQFVPVPPPDPEVEGARFEKN